MATETITLKKHTKASLFADLQAARTEIAELKAIINGDRIKGIQIEIDWKSLSNSLCERLNQLNENGLGDFDCVSECDDAIQVLHLKRAMSLLRNQKMVELLIKFTDVPER